MTKWGLFQKRKCPSMGEWINCDTSIKRDTVQQKRNKLLIHATTRMAHKCTVLREKSQPLKIKYCTVPFI